MSLRTRWLLFLVLPPLFWAGNAVVGRGVAGQIPPLTLCFWRWLAAGVLILPLTWHSIWQARHHLRQHWGVVVVLGLLSVGAYNTFLYMAVQTTTAINATLVGSSMPVMMIILARLWLDEPIRSRQIAGLSVSVTGLLLVVGQGQPSRILDLHFMPGDGLMLLATLSWAVYSVMLRRFPLQIPSFSLLGVLVGVGWLAIAPLAVLEGGGTLLIPKDGSLWAAIAYTAVFPSLLAYYFWNRGVAVVGAGTAGLYSYLIPFFTAMMGVPVLGEDIQWFHGAGGLLIFAGIVAATARPKP